MQLTNPGFASPKPTYYNDLVFATDGYVFISDPYGNVSTASNQSPPFFSSTNPISMAFDNLNVFMTDGSTLAYLNTSTLEMAPYASTIPIFNLISTGPSTISVEAATSSTYLSTGDVIWITGSTNFGGEYTVSSTSSTGQFFDAYTTQAFFLSTLTAITASNVLGIAPTFCAQTINWRGRLILYEDANNPQNIYAARVGDPFDWNYAALDEAAAWAANFSALGQIGQPVTAFIPFNADLALVSCLDQMWLIEGDPAAGGAFVLLSDHMGLLGPQAWCTSPDHTLYFVGTSGLYSLLPYWAQYRPPQLLTGQNYDQFFEAIDRNANTVSLTFDEVHKYIHIYITPMVLSVNNNVGTHLIFDTRNGGLWPVQYVANVGPTCVTSFVPGSPGIKQILALGGVDGNVHRIDDTATDDEGTAIASFITFAPVNPFPDRTAILQKVEVDMGESPSTYTGAPVDLGDEIDVAGTLNGWGSPGSYGGSTLAGVVNSTNTAFNTAFPINASTYTAWFITATSTVVESNPTLNGGTSITLEHPIIYYNSIGEFSTVGYFINYEVYGSGSPFNAQLTVIGGGTAADVDNDGYPYPTLDSTSNSTSYLTFAQTFTQDRRQPIMYSRLGGAWFSFTLSNSTDQTTWSFERAILTFTPSGINRQYR